MVIRIREANIEAERILPASYMRAGDDHMEIFCIPYLCGTNTYIFALLLPVLTIFPSLANKKLWSFEIAPIYMKHPVYMSQYRKFMRVFQVKGARRFGHICS